MVDELFAARGIIVSYETVRQWALKWRRCTDPAGGAAARGNVGGLFLL